MRRISVILVALVATVVSAGSAISGEQRSGSFTGLSNHQASGDVLLVRGADGWEVHLQDNFSFDGAPDPRIGFGRGGSFVDPTDFYRLKHSSGAQVYKVPADIDPSKFDDIFIWCRRYSVPLGVAKLN